MSATKIHTIRRNGRLEYRVGSDTGLSYAIGERVEEPFFSSYDAVIHAKDIEKEMGHFSPNETEAIAHRIASIEGRITYDLDEYVSTVESITRPESAKKLLLGEKEVEVLQRVADYLMNELDYPLSERHPDNVLSEGDPDEGAFELSRFEVTIDKLTDVNNPGDLGGVKPDPNLSSDQVKVLNEAYHYVHWLKDSYEKARTWQGKPIYNRGIG